MYVLSALKDIRKALDYIHSKGIAHGDLTTVNILINDKNIPKIIDFGIACFLEENCPWTISSDLLLLGKVFYQIVTQEYDVKGKYLNTPNNELNKMVNELLYSEEMRKKMIHGYEIRNRETFNTDQGYFEIVTNGN